MILRRAAILTLPAALFSPAMGATESLEDKVRKAYELWDAAFARHDAKAIGALYTKDAVFLPPTPTHEVIRGPGAIEQFFAGLFSAGVTEPKLELIEASGTPDLIVAAARWTARSKDNPMGGLATHQFAKAADGRLKIKLHIFN
jgi:ketosteroid isomerase-like protein